MNTLTLIGNISTGTDYSGTKYLQVGATCPQHPTLKTRHIIGLKINQTALAARLVQAINAGVVYKKVHVAKDIYSDEYIAGNCVISTRILNAELKRLGF